MVLQSDSLRLKDLLFRRYGFDVVKLPFAEFLELANFAVEEDKNERIREEWLSLLPVMYAGMIKYIPLKEYTDRRTGKNIDLRPASEIIAEIKELHGGELP